MEYQSIQSFPLNLWLINPCCITSVPNKPDLIFFKHDKAYIIRITNVSLDVTGHCDQWKQTVWSNSTSLANSFMENVWMSLEKNKTKQKNMKQVSYVAWVLLRGGSLWLDIKFLNVNNVQGFVLHCNTLCTHLLYCLSGYTIVLETWYSIPLYTYSLREYKITLKLILFEAWMHDCQEDKYECMDYDLINQSRIESLSNNRTRSTTDIYHALR